MPLRDDPDGTLWASKLGPEFESGYRDGLESYRAMFGPPDPAQPSQTIEMLDRIDRESLGNQMIEGMSRFRDRLERTPAQSRSELLDLLADSPEARAIRTGMERRK